MRVLSIKVPIRKKSGNLSYALRIYEFGRNTWYHTTVDYLYLENSQSYNYSLKIIISCSYIVANVLVCNIVEGEFEFHSRYQVHFQKGMNPLTLAAMG